MSEMRLAIQVRCLNIQVRVFPLTKSFIASRIVVHIAIPQFACFGRKCGVKGALTWPD